MEAFGGPTWYSPVEDSIVRTRTYELRNKLRQYYSIEAPNAPIRIEIDRGAYVPRFIRQEDSNAPMAPSTAKAEVLPVSHGGRRWIRASAAVGLLVDNPMRCTTNVMYAFSGSPSLVCQQISALGAIYREMTLSPMEAAASLSESTGEIIVKVLNFSGNRGARASGCRGVQDRIRR